jgi:hypothetical protein
MAAVSARTLALSIAEYAVPVSASLEAMNADQGNFDLDAKPATLYPQGPFSSLTC